MAHAAARVGGRERWRAHRPAALAVRLAVVLAPAMLALFAGIAAARVLPTPSGRDALILWWIAFIGIQLCVLAVTAVAAQRLLPLALLLQMTLAFPDHAPSRFRLARRRDTLRDLQRLDGGTAVSVQTLLEMVTALSIHDRATRGHSERVRVFAVLLGEQLRLKREDLDRLTWVAILHDIGKVRVPVTLLNKPARPDEQEWLSLRQHPQEGARLVAPLGAWLGDWARAVEDHHERWDGNGYPRGLTGREISLGGRIVAVADAFETMTAARPYKRPLTAQAARAELSQCAGTHFDPEIVRAFLQISLGRIWRVVGLWAWLAQVPLVPLAVTRTARRLGPQFSAGAAAALATAGLLISGLLHAPGNGSLPAPAAAVLGQYSAVSNLPTVNPSPGFIEPSPEAVPPPVALKPAPPPRAAPVSAPPKSDAPCVDCGFSLSPPSITFSNVGMYVALCILPLGCDQSTPLAYPDGYYQLLSGQWASPARVMSCTTMAPYLGPQFSWDAHGSAPINLVVRWQGTLPDGTVVDRWLDYMTVGGGRSGSISLTYEGFEDPGAPPGSRGEVHYTLLAYLGAVRQVAAAEALTVIAGPAFTWSCID